MKKITEKKKAEQEQEGGNFADYLFQSGIKYNEVRRAAKARKKRRDLRKFNRKHRACRKGRSEMLV